MDKNNNLQYISKDFDDYLKDLRTYASQYFPKIYKDFDDTSIGSMFLEMTSYVGDNLSFYLDTQIQENFIQYASQEKNIFSLSNFFGYKPKTTNLSTVEIEFTQLVPSKTVDNEIVPDYSYALEIEENTTLTSEGLIPFLLMERLFFDPNKTDDKVDIEVAQTNGNEPEFYLLRTRKTCYSGEIKLKEFNISGFKPFLTLNIIDENIANIISVVDYFTQEEYREVGSLGQDIVYEEERNETFVSNQGEPQYHIKALRTPKRFVTRFKSYNNLEIQFGAGDPNVNDLEVIPNQKDISLGTGFERSELNRAFNPNNFMFTNAYGTSPNGGYIDVTYIKGLGVESNIGSNQVFSLSGTSIINNSPSGELSDFVLNSLSITNPEAASGGGGSDSLNEIKLNTQLQYSSQSRTITSQDYKIRVLSLPPRYGKISKIFSRSDIDSNVGLYVLSFDSNNKLIGTSVKLRENIKEYLNQFNPNVLVKLKNAFILNIGCEFDIITKPNSNNNEVLARSITSLIDYFNIDNWDINKPIVLREIYNILDNIKGVQTVQDVRITNKVGEDKGYSNYDYDLKGANFSNIIYPPKDPTIFELKYPNTDIKGKIINF
jgi:hypothetical protein